MATTDAVPRRLDPSGTDWIPLPRMAPAEKGEKKDAGSPGDADGAGKSPRKERK
jgi:hypothetical protein